MWHDSRPGTLALYLTALLLLLCICRLNATVAKASAAAAGDSMRETMGRTIGAMRSLRFMQTSQQK